MSDIIKVRAAWNGDGDFYAPGCDLTPDVIGPVDFKSGRRPFERMGDEAQLSFTLQNESRRYSPEYSGGPLYGLLKRGTAIEVHHEHGRAGAAVSYFESGPYFTYAPYEGLYFSEEVAQINQAYATGTSPDPAVPTNDYYYRYLTRITPAFSEDYTFYLTHTGWARVYLDGVEILARNTTVYSTPTERTCTAVALTAGQPVILEIQGQQYNYASKEVCLRWASASVTKEIVPAAALEILPVVLWSGFIERILPEPFLFGPRTAEVTATGRQEMLDAYNLSPYLEFERDKPVAEAIREVLQQVFGSGVNVEAIGDAVLTVPYYGDGFQGAANEPIAASDVLYALLDYENGYLWFDRGGWHFTNRHALGGRAAAPLDLTIDNRAVGLQYATGVEQLANTITVTANPRVEYDPADDRIVIFEMVYGETPLEVPYGEKRTFRFPYTDQDGAPCAAEDVVIASLGSATDPVVNPAGVVDSDLEDRGRFYYYWVHNYRFANTYITDLVIEGRPISLGEPRVSVLEDADSIAAYGAAPLEVNLLLAADMLVAEATARYRLKRFATPAPQFERVTIQTALDGVTDGDQLAIVPGNVLRIIDDQTGHDSRYLVAGVEHRVDGTAQTHETTWLIELLPPGGLFTLHVSELDGPDLLGE